MSLSALPLPSGDSTCPPRHQKMSDLNYPQRSPAHPLWWTHCPAEALLELGSSLIYLHGSHPGSSSGVGPGGPCGRKPDKQEQKVKRAVKVPSAAPTPPPKHTPTRSLSPAPALPTCAFGSFGSGPIYTNSPSTGTRCPWRRNAVPCSAPGPRAGASWGAPQPPPSAQASSGQEGPLGSQPSP